jgi:CRISPR-associated protein (TIGR02584 family)
MQSVLLGFALQLYGRPQDSLLHALVDEAFENHADFFILPTSHDLSRLGMDASSMRAPHV